MKRFWIGMALLLILLIGGFASSFALEKLHTPISNGLSLAAEAALEDRWAEAVSLSQQAQSRWQRQRNAVAAMASHTPMEQIDSLFEELTVYRADGEALPFAACCASLSALINAMAEAHSMSWWNLL